MLGECVIIAPSSALLLSDLVSNIGMDGLVPRLKLEIAWIADLESVNMVPWCYWMSVGLVCGLWQLGDCSIFYCVEMPYYCSWIRAVGVDLKQPRMDLTIWFWVVSSLLTLVFGIVDRMIDP
ncbi:hypothetical protein OUZ56_024452 [Daphnia magna]|uniref:Uncharacterized protein n=1 Tax=Daphnia magna TaxID=35525 RepID=A0ABR0B0Z8_9CRUS|nr:hypothetical protein OUZ56_024452 [Daphnia magna]